MTTLTDWRTSTAAADAAQEIVELVDQFCERAKGAATTGNMSPLLAIQISQGAFFSAFDAAASHIGDTCPESCGNDEIDALILSLDEVVDPFADATGAERPEIVKWMRSQFEQAFDRHLAKARQ